MGKGIGKLHQLAIPAVILSASLTLVASRSFAREYVTTRITDTSSNCQHPQINDNGEVACGENNKGINREILHGSIVQTQMLITIPSMEESVAQSTVIIPMPRLTRLLPRSATIARITIVTDWLIAPMLTVLKIRFVPQMLELVAEGDVRSSV